MQKSDAVAWFGSVDALADSLGVRREAVYQWTRVPDLRQLQLELYTRGALQAEEHLKPRRIAALLDDFDD
jgi:hypothetical protein